MIGQLLRFTQISFKEVNTVLGVAALFWRLLSGVLWLLRTEAASSGLRLPPPIFLLYLFALKRLKGDSSLGVVGSGEEG